VLRLKARPTADELRMLDREFGDICTRGGFRVTPPLPPEVADNDHLDLPRIVFRFNLTHHGRLRQLINRLNTLDSSPPLEP
jgi:hypothetical protein